MDRLSSLCSSPIQDLIFFCCLKNKPDYHYEIYAVNLGYETSTGVGVLRPKVIVKNSKGLLKLCVVGYTLYIFSKDGKGATVDLSLFLGEDEPVVLDEEAIPSIASMNHPKNCLEVVPTPGGKLMAFSRSIAYGFRSSSGFELYDPATGCWADIPPINQHILSKGSNLDICSYTFSDDSTFVIQCSNDKTFHLILGDPVCHSRWHDLGWVGHRFPFNGFSRGIIGGGYELCLTSNHVWDIKNAGRVDKAVARFPTYTFQNDPSFTSKSRMMISGGRSSSCYFLEIAKRYQPLPRHYLRIREYHLDLVEYFEEKKGIEDKYFKDLEKVDGGWEREKIENRMMVISPELGWRLLRSSVFLLPPGSSHRLDDSTTFHSIPFRY